MRFTVLRLRRHRQETLLGMALMSPRRREATSQSSHTRKSANRQRKTCTMRINLSGQRGSVAFVPALAGLLAEASTTRGADPAGQKFALVMVVKGSMDRVVLKQPDLHFAVRLFPGMPTGRERTGGGRMSFIPSHEERTCDDARNQSACRWS